MSIKLSDKHGVNPSLIVCPCCGESDGIALHGRINSEDPEAPRHISGVEPCGHCIDKWKEQGGFGLLESFDESNDRPVLTGNYVVVKHDAWKRLAEHINKTTDQFKNLLEAADKEGYLIICQAMFKTLFGEEFRKEEK